VSDICRELFSFSLKPNFSQGLLVCQLGLDAIVSQKGAYGKSVSPTNVSCGANR